MLRIKRLQSGYSAENDAGLLLGRTGTVGAGFAGSVAARGGGVNGGRDRYFEVADAPALAKSGRLSQSELSAIRVYCR